VRIDGKYSGNWVSGGVTIITLGTAGLGTFKEIIISNCTM
jgi:hypothetical protein